MQNLKLRTFPDPFLMKPSQKIKTVKDSHIRTAFQMMQAMKKWNGVGLSAPQVGCPFAIVVIDTLEYDNGVKRMMYNPEIIQASIETFNFKEGCLSFPGETVETNRSNTVTVKYLNGGNQEITEKFEGISAVCIQHEIDHLNGKLFRS